MADEWCTESSFTVVHTEHRNKAANGVVNGLRDDDDDAQLANSEHHTLIIHLSNI